MDFKEATNRLKAAGVRSAEMAKALSYQEQSLRSILSGARKPPPEGRWRKQLVALARAKIDALQRFVEDAEK